MKTSKKIKEKIEILKKVSYTMYPEAKTELEYENDFQLLIAIIMSAQTTDKQVNKANKNFFKKLKTPEAWVKLWIEKIKQYIKSIWFYRNKAKNIFKTCEILSSPQWSSTRNLLEQNTSFSLKEKPLWDNVLKNFDTIEKLIALPWVWIKTAKVFLAITRDAPFLPIDTHVHRVLNRVWIVKTKSALETDKKVEKVLKIKDLAKLHHCLIMFWRYHCTARNPKCKICLVKEVCDYNLNKKSSKIN